jgi:tetrathionate reductase subunit C
VKPMLLYNVPHEASFGAMIALYIFFTGLSAGSFLLSTLSYGFGQVRYRTLARPAIVTATLMLIVAPVFLLLHVGKPLRSWHLFLFVNPLSPITWGSFLLTTYPIFCLLYMASIFQNRERAAKRWGLIGIPFAVSVHAYTGFILAFCPARALWPSSMVPLLFLVSAIVSGTALMILVFAAQCRWKGVSLDAAGEQGRLLLSLARILGWLLMLDLLMTGIDLLVASVSGGEDRLGVGVLLTGELALYFLGIEIILGKAIPLFILFHPRLRRVGPLLVASVLIIAGILFMRLDLVRVGEILPLL